MHALFLFESLTVFPRSCFPGWVDIISRLPSLHPFLFCCYLQLCRRWCPYFPDPPLPLRERKWMESSSLSLGARRCFFSNFTRACGQWFPPSWFRSHREGFNTVSSVGESRRIDCEFLSWQKTNHPKWENQPPKQRWCLSWKPYLGPRVKGDRLRRSLSLSLP